MTQWRIGATGMEFLTIGSADRPATARDAAPLPTHSLAYWQAAKVRAMELRRFSRPIDQTMVLGLGKPMCPKLYRAELALAWCNAAAAATAPAQPFQSAGMVVSFRS